MSDLINMHERYPVKEVKPISPEVAARLWNEIYQANGNIRTAIEFQQGWNLLPHLHGGDMDFSTNARTVANFLKEWAMGAELWAIQLEKQDKKGMDAARKKAKKKAAPEAGISDVDTDTADLDHLLNVAT